MYINISCQGRKVTQILKKNQNNKEYRPLISISTQARNFNTLFFVVIVLYFVFCLPSVTIWPGMIYLYIYIYIYIHRYEIRNIDPLSKFLQKTQNIDILFGFFFKPFINKEYRPLKPLLAKRGILTPLG